MKKMMGLCVVLVNLFLCIQTVHADVIWEPENTFYAKHSGECEMVDRGFTANGPNGEVIVYKSPENPTEVAHIPNGDPTWITWTYTDSEGVVWGCPNNIENGWVPMDYMVVIYDYISFEEEYGDKFVGKTGNVDDSYMGKRLYLWSYPGSEDFSELDLSGDWATWMPEYNTTYVDEEGRTWGYCVYYYGMRNFWVCLDNPEADYVELYGEDMSGEVKQEIELIPVGDTAPIVPKRNQKIGFIGAGVGVVALATGILLIKVKKTRRG